jgi:diacylglycerol kinase (ATP)
MLKHENFFPDLSFSPSQEESVSRDDSSPSDSIPFQRPPSWQIAPNLLKSFHYASMGVLYACFTQRNFRIHLAATGFAIGVSLYLHLSPLELALIGLTCGLVMTMELVNTALESVVDLTVGKEYHVLAKIAKDCAAGAVLIASLVAVFVAGVLFIPPVYQMLWIPIH